MRDKELTMKRNLPRRVSVGIGLALLVAACKPTVPSKYLQPDEMVDILYDLQLTQAIAQAGYGNKVGYDRNVYYLAVLDKYGVTTAEMDSSMVYYYTHADALAGIYSKVADRLEEQAQAFDNTANPISRFAQLSENGDTANIWRERQNVLLLPMPPYNRLEFEIKADTAFKVGDSFQMNFMSNFVYQNGTKDATAFIAVEYEKDSVACFHTNIVMSGVTEFRIPANDTLRIKRLRGFLYLDRGNDESQTLKLWFANNIQLIRFHRTKTDPAQHAIADTVAQQHPSGRQPSTQAVPAVSGMSISNSFVGKRPVQNRALPASQQ